MQSITIIWPMIAATALTLGVVHLLGWGQNQEKTERLWFFFMTVATAWMAFGELWMMKSRSSARRGRAVLTAGRRSASLL